MLEGVNRNIFSEDFHNRWEDTAGTEGVDNMIFE
jgi:hypothetical protein